MSCNASMRRFGSTEIPDVNFSPYASGGHYRLSTFSHGSVGARVRLMVRGG